MKRVREEEEEEKEEPESFYGHGKTWIRGMKMAKETSGSLYIACRYRKRPKNPRVFDHNIGPGIITVKSAVNDMDLMAEAMVLDNLHGCPHIRQMLGEEFTRSFKNGELVTNLLLEHCAGGNLVRVIDETGETGLEEASVRMFTRDVLMGLDRVHDEGYVYGGLKAENVLLSLNREFINDELDDCLKYVAKLGDFGMAKRVGERRVGRGGVDLKYMAPETLVGNVEDEGSDIWALGCVVVEMVQGYSIWDGAKDYEIEEILYGVEEGRKEGNFVFENLSDEGRDFLEKCLVRKEERWSAKMLLNHPFVRENMEYDATERAIEAVEEALEEVVDGAGGALEAAQEVLEAAKEVVEAVEGVEEYEEMARLTMSGDFIPLELQEEEGAGAVEDMSGDFIPLELRKEDDYTNTIVPSFQKLGSIGICQDRDMI